MSDMPRCKTCKHWRHEDYTRAVGAGFGKSTGYCDGMKGVLLLIHRGGTVQAATKECFGCVEHEERDHAPE